jgi:hypothetical protein
MKVLPIHFIKMLDDIDGKKGKFSSSFKELSYFFIELISTWVLLFLLSFFVALNVHTNFLMCRFPLAF